MAMRRIDAGHARSLILFLQDKNTRLRPVCFSLRGAPACPWHHVCLAERPTVS
jgi:hypothetical protein